MHRLFQAGLFLIATMSLAAGESLPAFAVGQEWSYPTRKAEADSRLVIQRIENHPKLGRIVHVGILGAKLRLRPEEPPLEWTIGHMPFPESVLRKNVTKLESASSAASFADFEKSYAGWKVDADAGKKQFWTAPVANAIDSLETMVLRSRK
jgi:hypothetical protein